MPIYRLIKNLCSFFNRTRNTYELIDQEKIIIRSGDMRGLVLEFGYNACLISVNNTFDLCLDIDRNTSADMLVQLLIRHNIIAVGVIQV